MGRFSGNVYIENNIMHTDNKTIQMLNERNPEILPWKELDIDIDITKKIGEIKHQYSHFKINLIGYHCIYKAGKPKPITSNGLKWITKKNINSFAFPKSTIKIFNLSSFIV